MALANRFCRGLILKKLFVFNLFFVVALSWSFLWFGFSQAENKCKQGIFKQVKGDCFKTTELSRHDVSSESECSQRCVHVEVCVGFKYRPTNEESNCKILKKIERCPQRENENNDISWKIYMSVKKPCSRSNVCQNGGSCFQNACHSDGFKCICPENFGGKFCEEVIGTFTSCKALFQSLSDVPSGAYNIATQTDTGKSKTYCQMTSLDGCAGGGWTMVMKIDGYKGTFYYKSPYWSNKKGFNNIGGLSGFNNVETKLPTYWSTSFNELCIGMKVGNDLRFLTISHDANSLHSLIADGAFHSTNVGKEKWRTLIAGSSLQQWCNLEGFNLLNGLNLNHQAPAVRLGMVANEQTDCFSPDSFFGLGAINYTVHPNCYVDGLGIPSSGNIGTCGGDNGRVNIKSMGYILVR